MATRQRKPAEKKFPAFNIAKEVGETEETDLKKVDNIEGLGYDATSRQLFFAAKGQKNGEFAKKIYFFRLESLSRQGLILRGGVHLDIKLADIQNFINNKVKNLFIYNSM